MSKKILVIDTDTCATCPAGRNLVSNRANEVWACEIESFLHDEIRCVDEYNNSRPAWCPLRDVTNRGEQMKLCKDCKNRGKKYNCNFYSIVSNYAERCEDFEEIKPTNADRIRSMSDEELAHLITSGELCAICPFCKYDGTDKCYLENAGACKNCDSGIIDWLKSDAEDIV